MHENSNSKAFLEVRLFRFFVCLSLSFDCTYTIRVEVSSTELVPYCLFDIHAISFRMYTRERHPPRWSEIEGEKRERKKEAVRACFHHTQSYACPSVSACRSRAAAGSPLSSVLPVFVRCNASRSTRIWCVMSS